MSIRLSSLTTNCSRCGSCIFNYPNLGRYTATYDMHPSQTTHVYRGWLRVTNTPSNIHIYKANLMLSLLDIGMYPRHYTYLLDIGRHLYDTHRQFIWVIYIHYILCRGVVWWSSVHQYPYVHIATYTHGDPAYMIRGCVLELRHSHNTLIHPELWLVVPSSPKCPIFARTKNMAILSISQKEPSLMYQMVSLRCCRK